MPPSAVINPDAVIVPHDVIAPVPSTKDVPVIVPVVFIDAVAVAAFLYGPIKKPEAGAVIVPDAVVTAILPTETVIPLPVVPTLKPLFNVNVPLTIVAYVELPRFIVFTDGTAKSVSVPIFIPPDAVESAPIIIGPVVRVAVDDPHPIYSVPWV